MDMKTKPAESRVEMMTGNEAAAEACKMAGVQVVGFFPIGPSDEVGERLVQMMRRGDLDARVIDLENERSVVNAQIVAAQAGVRTSFATNSEGLVFAYQPLFWAPYGRVPIVVHVAHRAMEPPTTIVTDDHDTIIFRDVHWLQFHCENAQDVFDTTLQAYRVAEDHEVLLPAFVTYAGWEVSHASYPLTLPTQSQVDAFLPRYKLPPGTDVLEADLRERQGLGSRPGAEIQGGTAAKLVVDERAVDVWIQCLPVPGELLHGRGLVDGFPIIQRDGSSHATPPVIAYHFSSNSTPNKRDRSPNLRRGGGAGHIVHWVHIFMSPLG